MKTLPCTVCGQESYERKEGSKLVIMCPFGHQKAYSVQEWNDAYANKMIRELSERVDKLESELNDSHNTTDRMQQYEKERNEARLLVRRLLDPDWKAAGIEKTAYKAVLEWGKGVLS